MLISKLSTIFAYVSFYQLIILQFEKGFPAVYVLTSSQTTEMYNAIWQKLFTIVPNLRSNVEVVHCDFEKAQINSAQEQFVNQHFRVTGCLFHYKQVSFLNEKVFPSFRHWIFG